MRPIDADALLQRWNNLLPRMARDKDGAVPIDFCLAIREVSAAPTLTLDDLRPKGRWVDKKNENVWCSVCQCHPLKDMDRDSVYYWKYEPDFCPNCGADMRGGGEDA